ncbi:hypothetical protein [Paenibacillus fonticola]|uniref:hypothetical protein n=1 Tax=Paenibacillus fonticola TaxID=379896 RepID=UPI0003823EF5|nr:hypothetical protein [Paenibacillus fonticola]
MSYNRNRNYYREKGQYVLVPIENNGLKMMAARDILFLKHSKKGKAFIYTAVEIIEHSTTEPL